MIEDMKFNYTRKEAAFSLGISIRTLDSLIHRGDLETRRIGKKVLVPREVLRRYASGNHPEATQAGATASRATLGVEKSRQFGGMYGGIH